MGKASELVASLTPVMGASKARSLALEAIEKGTTENDLGPAPALEADVITQVIKSLRDAQVAVPDDQVAVQVTKSTAAAAAAGTEPDIDVQIAQIQGALDGANAKIDKLEVHLNKSFTAVSQLFELLLKGVDAVDKSVRDSDTKVVELTKSLGTRQGPRAQMGTRAVAEANPHDDAAKAQLAQGQTEIDERFALQGAIQVEIAKAAQAENLAPGSQKARFEQLQGASMMLTRPIPARDIAKACNIQLPA